MKTYISEIIPKIQRFSRKLDELTLLTNQHWVAIDEISNSKIVYIFRENNKLLISQNGKVEKGNWEYLGNNSLLIQREDEIYLFKHGFLDENILALKVDGSDEFAFLINESKFNVELNSVEKITNLLSNKYLDPNSKNITKELKISYPEIDIKNNIVWLETDKGLLEIRTQEKNGYINNDLVFINGNPAPDGKYVYGKPSWFQRIVTENGRIKRI